MKSLLLVACALFGLSLVQTQQGVDPAYLRQYYQQLQQQQQQPSGDATPIYEQNAEQAQDYVNSSGQQLRVKNTVQEQVRAQQQQQYQQPSYVAPALRDYQQKHPQQIQHQTHQTHQHPQQPQQQQVVYRQPSQPQPQRAQQPYKPHLKAQQQQEEEDYEDQNASYQFGFDVKDDEFTNYQNRKEVRDGGVIKGSYSVVDSDGFIRTVKYTADPKEGFKAEVIREPTDIVVKIPTPAPQQQLVRPHSAGGHKQQQHQYHQYQ